MRRLRTSGFTIIEVLISLMVVGFLIMMAAPTFGEWLQNQQLRAGSDAVLNGLQVARSEAIRRNMLVQISFGPGTGWTINEISGTPAAVGAAVQSRSSVEGSPNAIMAVTPNGATSVTYSPLGSLTANIDGSASITRLDVSNPGGGACQPAGPMRCLRVAISGGGTVKMCDPQVVAPDSRTCPP